MKYSIMPPAVVKHASLCNINLCFILISVLLLPDLLSGQNNANFRTDNRSQMIATTCLDTSSTTIVTFDYLNYVWDTLFTINDHNAGSVWFSNYDNYHRRYFYYGINKINDSTFTTSFYSLDLYSQQIDSLFTIDGSLAVDMLYDIFRNSLLVCLRDEMLSYNLSSGILDTLMTIPTATAIYATYPHYFDYLKQRYTYLRSLPSSEWVSLNLKEAVTDTIIQDAMMNNMSSPTNTVFNETDGFFYGMSKDIQNNKIYVVSVDKNPNNKWVICSLPSDYWSHLNQQKACFDATRGFYLLPYYSDASESKLAIVNIQNQSWQTIPYSKNTNNHHLDNLPDPIIKLEDSILVSNWYPNYTWYFNDVAIPQSGNQIWKPASTGWYKVSVVRPDSSIAFSNSIYVAFANITQYDEKAGSISVYPNPARDYISVEVHNHNIPVKHIDIEMRNMSGQLVGQYNFDYGSEPVIISTKNLNSGIYFISAMYDNIQSHKKIIITR